MSDAVRASNLGLLKRRLKGLSAQDKRDLFADERLLQSLHDAYSSGNLPMMDYLLGIAPDLVDVVDGDQRTALSKACCSWKPNVLALLLRHGADVHRTEDILRKAGCHFTSLLHKAVLRDDLPLVRLLVKAGSDAALKIPFHGDCLEMAASLGAWKIFKHLLKTVGKASVDSNPAVLALARGNVKLFRKLWTDWQGQPGARKTLYLTTVFEACDQKDVVLNLIRKEGRVQDQIFFLELFGASLIRRRRHREGVDAWKQAMRLRKDAGHLHEKQPICSSLSDALGTAEVQTLEDLDRLPVNGLALSKQAVLVMQRHIPGDERHVDMCLYLAFVQLQNDQFQEALKVLHEAARNCDSRINIERALDVFRAAATGVPLVPMRLPLPLLEACIQGLQRTVADKAFQICRSHHLDTVLQFRPGCAYASEVGSWAGTFTLTLDFLLNLEVSATSEEKTELDSGAKSFMLLASTQVSDAIFFKGLVVPFTGPLLRRLVSCSESLYREGKTKGRLHLAMNRDGLTPLHKCALFLSKSELLNQGILHGFLDKGADLCSQSSAGERVSDILWRRKVLSREEVFPPLQCLAAREVAKLSRDLLPDNQAVRDFVSVH